MKQNKINHCDNIIQQCLHNFTFTFCLGWLCAAHLPLVCSLKLVSFSSSCSSSVRYCSSLWRRSATDTSWRSWRTRSLFFIRLLCNRFSSLFFSPSNYKSISHFSLKNLSKMKSDYCWCQELHYGCCRNKP